MAKLQWGVGRLAEALVLFEERLALCRKVLLPDHPELAFVLEDISNVKKKIGLDPAGAAQAASGAKFVYRRLQSRCAGPGCTRRTRGDGAPLDQCAGCLRTSYCGTACQAAWKAGHRKECKALRKEGAGAAAK